MNLIQFKYPTHLPRWLLPASLSALVAVGLVMLLACVLLLPAIIVERDLADTQGQQTERGNLPEVQIKLLDAQAKVLEARNAVRTTLLQGMGGFFFVATAIFTWHQLRLNREENRLKEEEQFTDRFTKAIDHIGNEARSIRLGGIHELERLAKDPKADPAAFTDILAAYICEHAPRLHSSPEKPIQALGNEPTADQNGNAQDDRVNTEGSASPHKWELMSLRARAPDVQTALLALRSITVPSFIYIPTGIYSLELVGVDFRFADLANANFLMEANLRRANLPWANLQNANLQNADLENAVLYQAKLLGANLLGANLQWANLCQAKLLGANLRWAKLLGANLGWADLRWANLQGANLQGADLQGANLQGADLQGADLRGATATKRGENATKWPDGFDPEAAGIKFIDTLESDSPAILDSRDSQLH